MTRLKKEERKELRKRYKKIEREKNRELLKINEFQLRRLLKYLDSKSILSQCNHSFRLTREWAIKENIDIEEFIISMESLGAYCDCEIILDIDPAEIFK
jgi:Ca2+-binding EF-hand superfamily protein